MPSLVFNNIAFTGKLNFVPLIKGAVFTASQLDRQVRGANGDLYGVAVSATSDTMVVGAYNGNYASVYAANGTSWTFISDLTMTSAQQTSVGSTPRYGSAVVVSGDWMAVSAPGNGTSNTGAVFLYRRVSGVWQTTASQQITTGDTSITGTTFGYSLSMDGTTLVVGHREGNDNHGAAHIFVFNGSSWVLQRTLLPTGMRATATNGQRVGWSVNVLGNQVIAGGPGNTAGTGLGIAIISTRTGSTWSAPQTIVPDTTTSDGFGAGVGIRANKYLVGAPQTNSTYVFTGTTQSVKLTVAGTGTPTILDSSVGSSRVGWSVDANADCSVVFAGAPLATAGAVYVFENVGGVWGPSAISSGGISKLLPSPSVTNHRFGWNVGMIPNGELIIGASGNGSSVAGAVYTFK